MLGSTARSRIWLRRLRLFNFSGVAYTEHGDTDILRYLQIGCTRPWALQVFWPAVLLLMTLSASSQLQTQAADHVTAPAAKERAAVVLLHGLARRSGSMNAMARALADDYEVCNRDYPSRTATVEALAMAAIPAALEACAGRPVHFVTHSMGGILLRYYLTQADIEGLGRVVMLGPPNQGSEIVDRMSHWWGFDLWNGPAGEQLGTRDDDLPAQLPAADFELGIIAGTKALTPFLSWMLPGDNDGKVSVESTRVEGMADFLSLPVTHTFMMRDAQVIAATRYFLEHGRFPASSDGQDSIKSDPPQR